MARRLRSRASNGRFRRATLANTFGLHVTVCEACRAMNTHNVGEQSPDNCRRCGAAMRPIHVVPCAACGAKLPDHMFSDDDRCIDCAGPQPG